MTGSLVLKDRILVFLSVRTVLTTIEKFFAGTLIFYEEITGNPVFCTLESLGFRDLLVYLKHELLKV